MKQRDLDSLLDIHHAGMQIRKYLSGLSKEVFFADELRQDGIIRQLSIIGEAVRRISKELKSSVSNIPWRDIGDLRNIVVHAYDDIEIKEIWTIAERDVPQL